MLIDKSQQFGPLAMRDGGGVLGNTRLKPSLKSPLRN
jgi:hypothetical protein